MTDSPASDAVVIERTFDAAVDVVWSMWVEPAHFSKWYGPPGAEIPVADMDVEVGGRRFLTMKMQTPNGEMAMHFVGEYREVVEHERLVYTESLADEHGNAKSASEMGMPEGHPMETVVTVVLAADGDGTKVSMTHAGIPADSPGAMGWKMAFDKLETYLAAA